MFVGQTAHICKLFQESPEAQDVQFFGPDPEQVAQVGSQERQLLKFIKNNLLSWGNLNLGNYLHLKVKIITSS